MTDEATPELPPMLLDGVAWSRGMTLPQFKARLASLLNDHAETLRLTVVTPGFGMGMTYQEKFAQAQAVQAMGEAAATSMSEADRIAAFPTLAASVGIEASTLWEAAQLVLARYAAFAVMSYPIERARLTGIQGVKTAQTAEQALTAYQAVVWPHAA